MEFNKSYIKLSELGTVSTNDLAESFIVRSYHKGTFCSVVMTWNQIFREGSDTLYTVLKDDDRSFRKELLIDSTMSLKEAVKLALAE